MSSITSNRRTLRLQAMQNIHQITPHQFTGSQRVYLDAGENIQVPCRAVTLTDALKSQIFLYDCSGAFGDPSQHINGRRGLPAIRRSWLDARQDTTTCSRQLGHCTLSSIHELGRSRPSQLFWSTKWSNCSGLC